MVHGSRKRCQHKFTKTQRCVKNYSLIDLQYLFLTERNRYDASYIVQAINLNMQHKD